MGAGYGGVYIAANTLSGGTLFLYKSRTANSANDGNSFCRFYSAPDVDTPKTEKIGFRSDGSAEFAGTVTANGTILTRAGGVTLDVGDRLEKTQAALTALKAAAQDNATDLAGLKAAIVAALANI